MKVLRPEQCVVDGKFCAACTEDIEAEKELNELEEEMKELESRIEKIHIRRRALRTAMNENHDPLIHKFPPEIASHIFIQYSPPSASSDKFDRSPLYLGAVCQKWRQLAWATPELWISLHIGSPGKYNDNLPQLVTEWLKRSASLPLTIRMVDRWGWVDEVDELINILNTHSARWRDMHFELPARHLHRISGSSQENILHRLVLCHPFSRPLPSHFSTFSMKSKPSPTALTLAIVGLPSVDIVWNNLTVASVNDIGVDHCIELIQRAPLLETLRLEAINPYSSVFPIPNTRIIRPHLHLLELSKIREVSLARILDSLSLPSLEKWIYDQSPFLLDNMISFVGCLSSTCLKIFKINVEEVDCHQAARLLSHLSSLEFLELRTIEMPPPEELISLLCTSAESPLYLPHLQSLEFSCGRYFPWRSLPRIFALSRWQTLRVKVNTELSWHAFYGERAKLILELVDKGFDLSIVKGGEIDLIQEFREEMTFLDAQLNTGLG
jgi:hypothetical protein